MNVFAPSSHQAAGREVMTQTVIDKVVAWFDPKRRLERLGARTVLAALAE
jgi:hypothetical protein